MKAKAYILLGLTVFILTIATVYCGLCASGASVSAGEEWSWENGAYNTFEGTVDLSGLEGKKLSIEMSSDLTYDAEAEQESRPVFVIVNGKRITMMKQSGTVQYQPEKEDPVLRFSGRLRLPQALRFHRITFMFEVKDEEGNLLRTVTADLGGNSANDVFYIPVDIRTISVIIAIAAAAVWTAALARNRHIRKNKEREIEIHADL